MPLMLSPPCWNASPTRELACRRYKSASSRAGKGRVSEVAVVKYLGNCMKQSASHARHLAIRPGSSDPGDSHTNVTASATLPGNPERSSLKDIVVNGQTVQKGSVCCKTFSNNAESGYGGRFGRVPVVASRALRISPGDEVDDTGRAERRKSRSGASLVPREGSLPTPRGLLPGIALLRDHLSLSRVTGLVDSAP